MDRPSNLGKIGWQPCICWTCAALLFIQGKNNIYICIYQLCRLWLRQGFDILKNKILHDVDSSIGMLTAIRNLLRTKDRGLLFLAIPCSSFSFMSSAQHARSSSQPFGDESYDWVLQGTRVAYRSALLIIIAIVRNVMWCVENPSNSTIIHLPVFRALLDYKTVMCQQIRWWGSQIANWNWLVVIHKHQNVLWLPKQLSRVVVSCCKVDGSLWVLELETPDWLWKCVCFLVILGCPRKLVHGYI